MKKGTLKKMLALPVCLLIAGMFIQAAADDLTLTSKDLNKFSWRNIGPWTFSGRITHVAVPRGQSLVYYVLTGTGGLWKTEDAGISFKPIFEKYGNMSMGFLAIAPSNPKILYLGTGESLHARASYRGNGLWKSTDAGKTWKHIGLKESFFIPRIEVDSDNPDIVYVAAEGKLYDNKMDCERGLYKSSDGGKTWTNTTAFLNDRGVVDFVIDPKNSEMVIIAAYKTYRRTWTFIDRQPDNHFYKTSDGGKTWKKLTNGLPLDKKTGRNGIAIFEKDPNIVYIRNDEEVNLGLSERDGSARLRAGRMFEDGFNFNRYKSYKINSRLLRATAFKPVSAKDEQELAQKLNEMINDRSFLKKNKIDINKFIATAQIVFKNNKEIQNSISDIKKTLKREQELGGMFQEINDLFFAAAFIDGPDKVHPEIAKLITYSKEGITDEKDFIAKKDELKSDLDVLKKLAIRTNSLRSALRKVFEGNESLQAKLKKANPAFNDYSMTAGRYQVINRFVLQTLYAGALSPMSPLMKFGVVYRSDDQGESWKAKTVYKKTSGGSDVINQVEAGYNGRLLVDPNDDKVVYAHETRITVSRDSGKTFKFVRWEGNHKSHVDSRFIWVDPANSKHILNCNDGGLTESWDGGQHWHQKETIGAQQFYDISVDNEMPYNVMGGTQDNGCWLGPSQNRNNQGVYPADWTYLPSGDGFYVVRNWWNPEYAYWESQFGGSRWGNLKTGEMGNLAKRLSAEERAEGKPRERYQWNAPIVLSPHNPGVVFIASQHVHRSMSRGMPGTFQTISPDLSKNIQARIEESKKTNLQYGTVFTFAESPVKPGIYWAGTDDGNVQVSTDFGISWTNITNRFYDKNGTLKKGIKGDAIPFDRWVMRVEPSNHDEKTCYVAFSGYRTHNEDTTYLYVTTDLGRTWKALSTGKTGQANDVEEDPHNADVLYLATDYGLLVSFDRGGNWLEMNTKVPDVIIKDMDIQKRDRDLAIASYGLGFYIADIQPFKEMTAENLSKDHYLFDIQQGVMWNRNERRGQSYGEFALVMNPPVGSAIYYFLKENTKEALVHIKDIDGKVIKKLRGSSSKGVQRVFWDYSKDSARQGQGRRFGMGSRITPGIYNVVLVISGKEVVSKKITVIKDPKI